LIKAFSIPGKGGSGGKAGIGGIGGAGNPNGHDGRPGSGGFNRRRGNVIFTMNNPIR